MPLKVHSQTIITSHPAPISARVFRLSLLTLCWNFECQKSRLVSGVDVIQKPCRRQKQP